MSYTKLIDLRNIDGKLIDLCGSKWNFSDGSINYQWGGGNIII